MTLRRLPVLFALEAVRTPVEHVAFAISAGQPRRAPRPPRRGVWGYRCIVAHAKSLGMDCRTPKSAPACFAAGGPSNGTFDMCTRSSGPPNPAPTATRSSPTKWSVCRWRGALDETCCSYDGLSTSTPVRRQPPRWGCQPWSRRGLSLPALPTHSTSTAAEIRMAPSGSRSVGSSLRAMSAWTHGTVRPSQRAASGRVSALRPSIRVTDATVPATGREVQHVCTRNCTSSWWPPGGRAGRCRMEIV